MAFIYILMDNLIKNKPENLCKIFISTLSNYFGYQSLFSSSENSERRLFLSLNQCDDKFMKAIHAIEDALHISLHISLQPIDVQKLKEYFKFRLNQAKNFYVYTDAEWTENFYCHLGDDLSRASLMSFLLQRMFAKVFWDCDTLHMIAPPIENLACRRTKLQKIPVIPEMEFPNEHEKYFLQASTFIFEQYAIPGLIEVKPGDTVLDIGAGCGDTALYFSKKICNSGHCFSFEPFDVNLKYIKKNIIQNHCENVTIIPSAISDKKEISFLDCNASPVTASFDANSKDTNMSTQISLSTVDEFSTDRHIDFIKADIEGYELKMLHGARETLRRDKPVCALTLYHREDDFQTLPKYLQSIHPDYKFYIRCDAEPMLFAVCP